MEPGPAVVDEGEAGRGLAARVCRASWCGVRQQCVGSVTYFRTHALAGGEATLLLPHCVAPFQAYLIRLDTLSLFFFISLLVL